MSKKAVARIPNFSYDSLFDMHLQKCLTFGVHIRFCSIDSLVFLLMFYCLCRPKLHTLVKFRYTLLLRTTAISLRHYFANS